MTEAPEILTAHKTFAVIGVSQNKQKYGYEVFETLLGSGCKVYAINPKYETIDDHRCYPSLRDLPEKPEVVVTLVPPAVTEKVIENCAELKIPIVWMPPGSWSELALSRCQENHILAIHDVCIVLALKSLPYVKA